jgi:pimeloyl-ACP methyl ester carboxylesterase
LLSFWLAVRPPRLAVPLDPRDYRLAVEPFTVTAADGVRLAAWLVPRADAPVVVLLHGYPAEKRDLLPLAAALAPSFAVVLVDLRYFGESAGQVTTLGWRERGDLRRLLDHLEIRGLGPIGVFGFSLGGAVALLTAGEDARIRAVAAYAPFADLQALARDLYAHYWLLREPLVALMRGWSRLFLGADLTRPTPAEAAARITVPVLLVHSRRDEQIAFHHAERLQRALAGNPAAEFELAAGGRHGELGPTFEQRLADFFRRALRSSRVSG